MNTSQQKQELGAISKDMRAVVDEFRAGKMTREQAETITNASGKNLKSLALLLGHAMREDQLEKSVGRLENKA